MRALGPLLLAAGVTACATTRPPVPTFDWRAQVIYLAMPDRFVDGDRGNDAAGAPGCFDPAAPTRYHGGDLAGLRSKVGYLGELGVTSLWITPVNAQSPDRCGYHGYWADLADPDDGAVHPTLGSLAELQGLAGDLHAAGMRLILDLVVNHAGPGARIVAQHPDWFHDRATCAALGPAEVYCPIGGMPLPDFAQEKPEVARYLNAMSAGWVDRVGLDGIRMDTVKHVPLDYWRSSWIPAVRAGHPGLFLLGEVFDTGPAAHLAPYLDAGFDSVFDFPLMAAMVSVLGGGGAVDPLAATLRDLVATLGQARTRALTTFLDNHDLPRFASVPAGVAPGEIHRRLLLALGALFTLPGIPQLYYGDEIGMLGGKDPDNRRDLPSWAFTREGRLQDHPADALPGAEETFSRVQRLIRLRRAHPALVRGDYVELRRQGEQAASVLAFLRGDGAAPIVVALNNGAATPVEIVVAGNEAIAAADRALLGEGAQLEDVLGAGAPPTATIADGKLSLALPEQTMGIYRMRR